MPSTYTANGGIELPANGEQSATWGITVNDNMSIIDRLTNGVGAITLSGTTHTLTTSSGALSDGQHSVLVLGGSPSGTNTVTVAPNDGQHVYIVKNSSTQTATFTQGSGANVSVLSGTTKILYCDGAGSSAAVVDVTGGIDLGTLIVGGTTVTATGAELNILDGVTANTAQLNILSGATPTTAELNYVSGVTSAIQTQINNIVGVPAGAIIMWSGVVGAIPAGWYLCDGTNGTPNLVDRFVRGASGGDELTTGGSDSVVLDVGNLPSHDHTFSDTSTSAGSHSHTGNTSNTGAHTHTQTQYNTYNGLAPGSGQVWAGNAINANTGSAGSHSHTITTNNTGAHTHDVSGTTSATGSGDAVSTIPEYIALAYIMKA
jgi:hypothetical protein